VGGLGRVNWVALRVGHAESGPFNSFVLLRSGTLRASTPVTVQWHLQFLTMSEWLKYEECYRRLEHNSVINTMVVGHDGRRLVTGSDDSTVLVWSISKGKPLCRIKTHSPVLSIAWVRNSNGFFLGCKDGRLASVDLSEEVLYMPSVDSTSNVQVRKGPL
jgi:WD40 repeat protein